MARAAVLVVATAVVVASTTDALGLSGEFALTDFNGDGFNDLLFWRAPSPGPGRRGGAWCGRPGAQPTRTTALGAPSTRWKSANRRTPRNILRAT